jgi:DNA-binding response OmpR family regulator
MQPASDTLAGLNIMCIAETIAGIEPLVHGLRAAGATVIAVRTPQVALAHSDRHPLDAVLVDLRAPGWWFTAEIRALRALSRTPVYALTEQGEMIDATAGLAGYFVKPVRLDALITTLSTLPRRSR